jgi:hypothetical protein
MICGMTVKAVSRVGSGPLTCSRGTVNEEGIADRFVDGDAETRWWLTIRD